MQLPKLASQLDPFIDWGSPLALQAFFVLIIRLRFSGLNAGNSPWIWKDGPKPGIEETNQATNVPGNEAEQPSTLYIEGDLLEEPEARRFAPAIIVGIEDRRFVKVITGDRLDIDRPTREERFSAFFNVGMKIDIISERKNESAIISDMVLKHLIFSKNVIRDVMGVHEFSDFIQGKTQPYKRTGSDPTQFTTSIMVQMLIQEFWLTKPIAALINEISVNLTSETDSTYKKLLNIVLHTDLKK